ncbi:histone-lysine N-methyltransferase SETMAR [Trichonephila clavipes]|nr:histone-lysine N-methyltransferase SETMAR [Trichonephila clavipes]
MYHDVTLFDKLNLFQFDWLEIEEFEMQLIDFQSNIRLYFQSDSISIQIQKFIETRKKLELEAERLTSNTSIFDVKIAPRTGRPVIENVDKITEIIEVDRHVSNRNIAQELKINHKTVLSNLCKVGFKKKLDVWVPHQLTPKKHEHDGLNFHLRSPHQTKLN